MRILRISEHSTSFDSSRDYDPGPLCGFFFFFSFTVTITNSIGIRVGVEGVWIFAHKLSSSLPIKISNAEFSRNVFFFSIAQILPCPDVFGSGWTSRRFEWILMIQTLINFEAIHFRSWWHRPGWILIRKTLSFLNKFHVRSSWPGSRSSAIFGPCHMLIKASEILVRNSENSFFLSWNLVSRKVLKCFGDRWNSFRNFVIVPELVKLLKKFGESFHSLSRRCQSPPGPLDNKSKRRESKSHDNDEIINNYATSCETLDRGSWSRFFFTAESFRKNCCGSRFLERRWTKKFSISIENSPWSVKKQKILAFWSFFQKIAVAGSFLNVNGPRNLSLRLKIRVGG